MTKKSQDGRSLKLNIENVSTKNLVEICDLTYEQAERIINTRRVLKVQGDDSTDPQIDARKLWVKIGKPHKEFRKWAEDYIKPILEGAEKSPASKDQVKPFTEVTGRTNQKRTNYYLSRDVAAEFAMMARTEEGHQIRRYFLDIEKIAMKLYRVRVVRSDSLSAHDKAIYRAVVSGEGGNRERAEKAQKDVRNMVPEVLSGKDAGWWRDEFGKGIRDVLSNDDLITYDKAMELVSQLIKGGIRKKGQIKQMVESNYGGAIDIQDYL